MKMRNPYNGRVMLTQVGSGRGFQGKVLSFLNTLQERVAARERGLLRTF
jgi:hypothetical protein